VIYSQVYTDATSYLSRDDLIDLPSYHTSQPHNDSDLYYPWENIFHYPYFQYQTSILAHQWKPMTYEEIHRYYNAYEACLVMANNAEHCLHSSYKHNNIGACGIYDRGKIFPQDTPCPNMKGNFIRHVSTQPWPESKHIVDIMTILKEHDSNFIYFIGDSVTGQHFAETFCSLSRIGLTFSLANQRELKVNNPNNPITIKNDNDNYFTFRLTKYDRDRGGNQKWLTTIQEIETVLNETTTIMSKRVVFIVNIGLHFNNQKTELNEMHTNLRIFFSYFKHLAETYGHIIIFRETSAQHFQTSTGLYTSNIQFSEDYDFILKEVDLVDNQIYRSSLMTEENRQRFIKNETNHVIVKRPNIRFCRPFRTKEELDENNWRNKEVFKILHEIDPLHEYIYIAKFHEITAGRHDMHAIGTDCTHFCPSPIIWYPLWEELYYIIHGHFKAKTVLHEFQKDYYWSNKSFNEMRHHPSHHHWHHRIHSSTSNIPRRAKK
jgi:hypothetical protein